MEDSHTKSVPEVLHYFKTEESTGLSDAQVKEALEKYGLNGKSNAIFKNQEAKFWLVKNHRHVSPN